jgi:hypothetical protein
VIFKKQPEVVPAAFITHLREEKEKFFKKSFRKDNMAFDLFKKKPDKSDVL